MKWLEFSFCITVWTTPLLEVMAKMVSFAGLTWVENGSSASINKCRSTVRSSAGWSLCDCLSQQILSDGKEV